jgi:hypothetical protein
MRLLPLLVLIGLLVGKPALAAAPATEKAPRKHLTVTDALTVEGTVQKPHVEVILTRARLEYRGVDRPSSFLPKIQKSLEHDPF